MKQKKQKQNETIKGNNKTNGQLCDYKEKKRDLYKLQSREEVNYIDKPKIQR